MTKSLTEQWREGKLPEDTYYVQFLCGRYGVYEFEQFKGFGFDNDLAYIKEVLAPVPSYDEYEDILQQNVNQESAIEIYIEEIKRLQEQLKEANEVIKLYAETFVGNKNEDGTFTVYVFGSFPAKKNVYGYQELRYDPRPAKKWLKKWGVK